MDEASTGMEMTSPVLGLWKSVQNRGVSSCIFESERESEKVRYHIGVRHATVKDSSTNAASIFFLGVVAYVSQRRRPSALVQ